MDHGRLFGPSWPMARSFGNQEVNISRTIHPQAKLFSRCAAAYRKWRPAYPSEAITKIVERFELRPGNRICDVGAGTGVLSLMMARRGFEVVAIEPLWEMLYEGVRQANADRLPVRFCQGIAEKIPLLARSVKAVTCAQAFHWFDPEAAFGEIYRVLVDRGCLALMWNFRDCRSVSWLAILEQLIQKYNPTYRSEFKMQQWKQTLKQSPLFEPVEYFEFYNDRYLGRNSVLELVRTFSYVCVLAEPVRAQLEEEINGLLDHEIARQGKKRLLLRYRTELYIVQKR